MGRSRDRRFILGWQRHPGTRLSGKNGESGIDDAIAHQTHLQRLDAGQDETRLRTQALGTRLRRRPQGEDRQR